MIDLRLSNWEIEDFWAESDASYSSGNTSDDNVLKTIL